MSHQLISRSLDLKKLRDEGYDIEVKSGYLFVKNVPYVGSDKKIACGILVSKLTLAGDVAVPPDTHVAYFIGGSPCDKNGSPLDKIINSSQKQKLDNDVEIDCTFSAKPIPDGKFKDHYDKTKKYVASISGHAYAIDPSVTATIFPVLPATDVDNSVFNYIDSASSRAQIGVATSKLEIGSIAIVGVGGTGSYILDLVSKTPVSEIHIFDGDKFLNHNAFRMPGAPSIDELRGQPQKVFYLKDIYSRMHRHIIPHNVYVDSSNVDLLKPMKFVFICLDKGSIKKCIVEKLEEWGTSFIDVGMGLQLMDGSLTGVLAVTSSTIKQRKHVKDRISFLDDDEGNEYSENIQIADLNAFNAALAVVKWKKIFGFYKDLENEHFCAYSVNGNVIINEDRL